MAAAIVRAIVREETERAHLAAETSGERQRLRVIERVEPRDLDAEEGERSSTTDAATSVVR